MPSKPLRIARTLSFAALLLVAANGVPLHGHAHERGHAPHVGTPEHSHGFALLQYDLRVQPLAAPSFAAPGFAPDAPALPRPALVRRLPAHRDRVVQSRAPPAARPRAPPL